MQSSRKASGALTFEVGMDTTTAFNSVSTLKRTVRELTNEWKSQYHALMQIGQVEEANKSKRDGLNRVTEKEAELNKFLNGMYEHSASLKGLNAQKQNRLTDELLHSETALSRQRAELERVNRQLILNSDTVYKANENAKITKELSMSRVASLQAEGREYSATAAKMAGYSDRIKATQEQLRQQTKSMAEFRRMAQQDAFNNYKRTNEKNGIKGNKTLDDFANAYETDSDYKRSLIQNNKTKASLATLKHEARDYRLQLFQLKEESKSYSSVTSSMVSQLKAQRRENTAGLYELKRLQRQLSIDTNLYKAQAAKMREVAIESGKNTNAYRNEQTKLNNLGTTYTNHAKKVNSLRGSYGQLSDKSAASMDRISGHVNKMSRAGDKMISTGGSLRNSTMLVGAAFMYGAKKATQLENTYVKISNLAKTGGENVSEATKNVSQMQKDGRKYSIQYGKSMTSIAHGYEDLVKRGYTTKQALGAMQGELQASVASGDKFSDVVQVASQTLEGFGMRAASSSKMTANTKEVVNDLAYAADMTASDFHSIGKGMEYVGATSHNMHFSLAETSAALGVLSNNGLEADKALVKLAA